ncbi:NAD(P)-binding protein [Xylaria bambusicola]|uniref:NAD(P)-binding protein n=1 Tax=Xylaria bambusicola TaxID=326684 RepID=UPI0020074A10|nr:NAD(P)-binding protein [Xylaria bambusicola]KAI0514981.1 NAD(P)-binding protein [Xylaria bambusicola]
MTSNACVIGCTGLVGHQILKTLLNIDACETVSTISRRAPKTESSPKLDAAIETDTAKWASRFAALSPIPQTVYSALGTTRAQAGGIQNQWKIDHDLNVELAKAAHAAGTQTFVFVSSAGTRGLLSNVAPYSKMKIGVEDTIKSLGFKQAIILRPGFLMGERDVTHTGGPLLETVFRGMKRYLGQGAQDTFAQEDEVVARAAVKAAILASEGKAPSDYWVLEQRDIVRLGRDEWKA